MGPASAPNNLDHKHVYDESVLEDHVQADAGFDIGAARSKEPEGKQEAPSDDEEPNAVEG